MFNILNLTERQLVRDDDGDVLFFESGKEAQAYITEQLTPIYPTYKFQPKPALKGDDGWKAREAGRFFSGEYRKVEVLENKGYTKPEHFLHLSTKNSVDLAYTKNEEKGRDDAQTKISLRGYLEKYFSNLSSTEMNDLRKEHEINILRESLKFAFTPEDIARVYTRYDAEKNGVGDSCMRHPPEEFSLKTHPASVYGAGDLAIAYIANDDNYTTHRALVWPDKKIYGRVYGSHVLHDMLKSLGYTKSSYHDENNVSMAGARLLKLNAAKDADEKLPEDEEDYEYIVPYIDEPLELNCLEQDTFIRFVARDKVGNMDNRRTEGISKIYEIRSCFKCYRDKRSNGLNIVTVDIIDTPDEQEFIDQEYCSDCQGKNTYYCLGDQRYFDKDKVPGYPVKSRRFYNQWISDRYFKQNLDTWTKCQRDPKNVVDIENAYKVIVDEAETIQLWCYDAGNNYTWTCPITSKLYSKDINPVNVQTGETEFGKRKIYSFWSKEAAGKYADVTKDLWGRESYISHTFLKEKELAAVRQQQVSEILDETSAETASKDQLTLVNVDPLNFEQLARSAGSSYHVWGNATRASVRDRVVNYINTSIPSFEVTLNYNNVYHSFVDPTNDLLDS